MTQIIVTGILLSGTYALIALGLTLQYGVARIMNLANGETLVAGCLVAMWLFATLTMNPIIGLLIIAPAAFAVNWGIYKVALEPLVKRARNRGQLEVDSILATFGLMFLLQGIMLLTFGGEYFNYTFLAERFDMFGSGYGLNRVVAFVAALVIAATLYYFLYHTRQGTAMRSVAADPKSARPVAIVNAPTSA